MNKQSWFCHWMQRRARRGDDPQAERHLAHCPACMETMSAFSDLDARLRAVPDLIPAAAPPADLWERIDRGIETRQPRPAATLYRKPMWVAAGMAMASLAAGLLIGKPDFNSMSAEQSAASSSAPLDRLASMPQDSTVTVPPTNSGPESLSAAPPTSPRQTTDPEAFASPPKRVPEGESILGKRPTGESLRSPSLLKRLKAPSSVARKNNVSPNSPSASNTAQGLEAREWGEDRLALYRSGSRTNLDVLRDQAMQPAPAIPPAGGKAPASPSLPEMPPVTGTTPSSPAPVKEAFGGMVIDPSGEAPGLAGPRADAKPTPHALKTGESASGGFSKQKRESTLSKQEAILMEELEASTAGALTDGPRAKVNRYRAENAPAGRPAPSAPSADRNNAAPEGIAQARRSMTSPAQPLSSVSPPSAPRPKAAAKPSAAPMAREYTRKLPQKPISQDLASSSLIRPEAEKNGDRYYRQGKWKEAIIAYRKIRAPGAGVLYKIGVSHLQLGQREEATEAFESALRLNPRFEPARQALQSLKS
ncbi:MAG: tetratricopeptide repeat protein [Armatimonadetes bacterium]|nr:tetratricopeptide repeat protein [Armatimonadota bacterium]